ncbi:hypothetical protein TREMEDRAFT_72198 [Tremella mesenterica DSM 1558]|uniref:uncharacterized protein n=1 Tax=Tremella mesenterica (strain ATCC 24925 / CBS 8224 / DSM 1558 / NBRC 9311 / NRRL Y-6157 / RJB 2259-6 / UBC 559-6) TaxID=578456 RepID=UPI0003F49B0F|nr:uncharacterized protein TREMEDRAFT_72198 [Tremella mesenterica DSM 1558]EIW67267.1 hypothetical protein TREMEDRAFT_72198 [Tremella mesenterica DSM 1558]
MNFYKSAASVIDHLDKHQGSVKGSLVAAGLKLSPPETKRVLALVIETLKYRPVLIQLLDIVPLLSLERITFPKKTPPRTPSSRSLILVLLHDLLFSTKSRIEASDKWPPKEAILKHKSRFHSELVKLQIREGKQRKEDLARSSQGGEARYVRWNPNIDLSRPEDWSLDALFRHLKEKYGFENVEETWPIPSGKFFMDPHLPDCLLVFPPGTNWWIEDEWYASGAVILQDKASCFPAKVLMHGWRDGEGECLDATAAPGNKTSHLAALMGNRSTIWAFERSKGRFITLEKMLAKAGCNNVKVRNSDFLESNPRDEQFAKVTRILLDPSCSGSGIVNRLDYLVEAEVDESGQAERLDKLAAFQLQMILHAFQFPAARRIVYSTCSIHAEEDEQVARAALQSSDAQAAGWKLAPRAEVLPAWSRRGRAEELGGEETLAESVIRCLPDQDKTNGFFVACFVRNSSPILKSSAKRSVEEMQEEDAAFQSDLELEEGLKSKIKTQAQQERARRKKQSQKKRRKTESTSG